MTCEKRTVLVRCGSGVWDAVLVLVSALDGEEESDVGVTLFRDAWVGSGDEAVVASVGVVEVVDRVDVW